MLDAAPFAFENSYARLPEGFFARVAPTPVSAPRLVRVNPLLAAELGLDAEVLASAAGVEMLAGNRLPPGADPIAMAYAGHQFGNWVPQLGDGRAILLGEVRDRDGRLRDVQLKGAGQTPFSRMGDGRAVLGPVLREYLVSEAMHALGIPTTRSLAAVLTGDFVVRRGPQPGAVLTRVANSHVRVGTFEFFANRGDVERTRQLADYVIARLYPAVADAPDRYAALLRAVIARTASLVAQWQGIGFIHGVMNTDNTSISGETIDYGPCAFMDTYDPATVYSSIDTRGRYAYRNQPGIAQWNLACFAQALLPLLDADPSAALAVAQAEIDAYPAVFDAAWLAVMRRKLGLHAARDDDRELVTELLECMTAGHADFTLTFRRLCDGTARTLFAEPDAFDAWTSRWHSRLAAEGGEQSACAARMRAANPAFIPRNHRIEAVIDAAERNADFAPFEALHEVLSRPFDEQPGREDFAAPPRPDEVVQATFCGT